MDESDQKYCIACGGEIPSQASICNRCGSYQSGWKNTLRYLASVVGVLSVVFGATAFVISSIPSVRQVIAWKDEVRVLNFATNKPITIVNAGDGDVFVTHINISGSRPSGLNFSSTERIGSLIEVGKLVTIDRDIPIEGYKVATSTDPAEIDRLINVARLFSDSEACVRMVFAIPDDPGFTTFSSFLGEKMVTFDVNAFVRFFSIKKQTYYNQKLTMIGYLIVKDGCEPS